MSTAEPPSGTSVDPIIVVSSDGRRFPMDLQMIAQSGTLNKLVITFGYDKDTTKREPIPVSNVSGNAMEKVVEWLEHYRNDPVYVEPSDKNHLPSIPFSEWDRRFMKMSNTLLYEMINAANFLSINRLYDATCKKVANMITGKTAEQIRTTFGIKFDDASENGTVESLTTPVQMLFRKLPAASFPKKKHSNALINKTRSQVNMGDRRRFLKLESSDGYVLQAEMQALYMSKTLKSTIQRLGYDTGEPTEKDPIPVKDVCGSTLQLVLEWCEKRKCDGPNGSYTVKVIGRNQKELIMPKWDQKFFRKICNRQLFDLVCAAHSLGIGPLMEVGCKAISDLAKGKTTEEIRVIYGIKPDWEEPSTSSAT